MSVSRSESERRYSLEGSGRKTGSDSIPGKWSPRRTLLFIVGAASLSWAAIIYTLNLIF